MGLSQNDVDIIKSTIPFLEQSGENVTQRMYEVLFSRYPDTKHIFQGVDIIEQHKKLANVIVAYAKNVETPENLTKAVDKIAHTHTNVGVKPEHYSIVGECLLQAIMDVAGADEKSPVIDSWGRAFITIAELLMAREKELYESSQNVA